MIPSVADRDRVFLAAPTAPGEMLALARAIADPWYRAQALAAVARWIDDDRVESVAGEAITAALACHDDYQRSAVLAWPIACLAEREHLGAAHAALKQARTIAATATPASSRAYSLLGLLEAAWTLGPDVRRSLVRELADLQRSDGFWRVSQALVDALQRIQSSEPEFAQEVALAMTDDRWQRKARTNLAGSGCAVRELFRR